MSLDLALLLATLVFIVPMCFTPGPNNVLCAAHGSSYGFQKTLPLIAGMGIGWSILGLGIAAGAEFLKENELIFIFLSYVGAIYIAYLGYKIASSKTIDKQNTSEEHLGFFTGILLQFINGKAWIHFIVLMTTFGALFGTGYYAKAALVILNLFFGLMAVLSWTAFGTVLRKTFSGEEAGIMINKIMGILLILVAIWIAVPH
jgi:threonine/homoserine/homoserine lactone efflux protein